MKKFLLAVSAVVVVFSSIATAAEIKVGSQKCQQEILKYAKNTLAINKNNSHCILTEVAKLLNKKLPIKLDSYTKMDKITKTRTTLVYEYTMAEISEELISAMRSKMPEILLKNNCGQKDVRAILKADVMIRHIYKKQNGKIGLDFTVTEKKCKKWGY